MIWCVTLNPALDITYRMDGLPNLGQINRAESMDTRLGGKGNNVARTVRALGSAVTIVTPLGGFVGQELYQRANALDIRVLAEEIEEESRVCIAIVSKNGEVTELRPRGPIISVDTHQALLRRLLTLIADDDWVTISGSLPRGTPTDTYADWVRALKSRAAGVIVDTAGLPLVKSLAEHPSAIVPNRDEYAALDTVVMPHDTDVIVTEGARGVTWYSTGKEVRRWMPAGVTAVNPVGAGDTFLGALVNALALGSEYEEAIPYAVAVASASVESLGIATFNSDRVREIYRGIREGAP